MNKKIIFSFLALTLFIGGVTFIEKFKASREIYLQNDQGAPTVESQQAIAEGKIQEELLLDGWFTLSIPASEQGKFFSIQRVKDVTSILFFKKYEKGRLLHDQYDSYSYIGSIGVSSSEQNQDFNLIFHVYKGQIIPKNISLLNWIKAKQKENISPDIPQEALVSIQEMTKLLRSADGAEIAYFQMPESSSNGWYAYRNQNLLYLFSMGNSSDAIHGMRNGAWDSFFTSIKQNTGLRSRSDVFSDRLGPTRKEKLFSIPSDKALPSFCPECEENGVDPIEGQNWEFTVSQDGKQYAYMAYADKKEQVILNGKPLNPYTSVHHLTFSSDGKSFSYHAFDEARGETYIVLNGREIPVYPEDEGYPHAANGVSEAHGPDNQFAYARVRKESFDEMEIYLNDQLINKVHGYLVHFWFSEDGKHLNYVVLNESQKGSLYEDDKLINDSVDYNTYSSPQYSQYVDGIRMKDGDIKIQVVDKGVYVDGQELANYTGRNPEVYLDTLMLSPAENNLLYKVWINGGKQWISLNGNDAKDAFNKIQDLKFSQDGKSISYVGRVGRDIYLVTHDVRK